MTLRRSFGTGVGAVSSKDMKVHGDGGHPADAEGKILRHPGNGSYVARLHGFADSHHHSRESASAALDKMKSRVSHTTWANKRGKQSVERHTSPAKGDVFEKTLQAKGYTVVKSHRDKE